ncbi:MAG: hypothetical protein FWC43_04485 [Planctomycetaceae bacterium]|nr:hypothetical protein [Planctomycetaceae bacterium]
MLSFRFSPELKSQAMLEHAFYASWGRVPQLTQLAVRDNLLLVRPGIKGTGTVHIPMRHPRYGIMLRSTETLQQRVKPYLLFKELGRGELGRLLRLLHEWKIFGFVPSDALDREVRGMIRSFSIMATSNETLPATEQTALELFQLLGAMEMHLVDQYFEHMITAFQRRHSFSTVPFGIFLDQEATEESLEKSRAILENNSIRSLFHEAFQLVAATPSWKNVESSPGKYHWEGVDRYFHFVERLGKKPLVGPILSFNPNSLPQWVCEKINDHEAFEEAAIRYTIEFVKRYKQQGSHWIVAGDFFSSPKSGFSVGRGVALVCDLIREVKYAVRDRDVLVSIDQPCGDYYRTNDCSLPFIAIAESLASVHSLDGFLLNFKLGMNPQDTLPRDPMLLGRYLDQWSIWGKKLYTSLSVPSRWDVFQEAHGDDWHKQIQSEWIVRIILLCLTRQNIHGVFWNSLSDGPEEESAGLIGTDGQIKTAFHKIAALRQLRGEE